ncbi:4689_t:CDS:2 [Diversispora eburnea]|uniref:4689_t:CDS:1 n=1 Tax=Diversispora eburnea TaxID=1213867 RepID=A0A9N8YU55_9GLOM|nr:4689_t:CDS:2 [Diversispora eburnea]
MSQISLPNSLNSSTLTPHNHIKNKRRLKDLIKLKEIIIPPSTNLKINLVEPILFMRGISEESAGCFLRGELILNLSKPTKIQKIEMKFTGKMKTFWPEGKIYHGSYSNNNNLCETRNIFSHTWNFLDENNFENSNNSSSRLSRRFSNIRSTNFQLLPSGTLSYPFELFVPGYLPETIEAERGKITYKLVANVVKHGLSINPSVTRYVPIIRTLLDEEILEGIVLSKNWNHCLNYDINIPKKAYSLGDSIDIDLKLTPLVRNLHIINVKIKLAQEAIYEEGTQKFEELKILNSLQLEDYELSMNKNLKGKKNQVKIKFDVPIQLLSCRCSITDELPIYEGNEYYSNNDTRLNNFIIDSVIVDDIVVGRKKI